MSYTFIENNLPKPLSKDEFDFHMVNFSQGDMESRNILIKHNIRIVLSVAKKYKNCPYETNELVSIGIMGLIKAVDTFDINKGVEFISYAYRCINNEILMFLRRERKRVNDLSLSDVIEIAGVDKGLYRAIQLDDCLEDESIDIAKDLECAFLYKRIRSIISKLPDKERTVVILYFGFNDIDPMSQEKVAEYMGISRSYVSRLLVSTLEYIKYILVDEKLIEEPKICVNRRSKCRNSSKKGTKSKNKTKVDNKSCVDEIEVSNVDFSFFRKMPCFEKILGLLDVRDAIVISLVVGYVDGKCFTIPSIADFLGIEEDDVVCIIKRVILLYKDYINEFVGCVIDDVVDSQYIKK